MYPKCVFLYSTVATGTVHVCTYVLSCHAQACIHDCVCHVYSTVFITMHNMYIFLVQDKNFPNKFHLVVIMSTSMDDIL